MSLETELQELLKKYGIGVNAIAPEPNPPIDLSAITWMGGQWAPHPYGPKGSVLLAEFYKASVAGVDWAKSFWAEAAQLPYFIQGTSDFPSTDDEMKQNIQSAKNAAFLVAFQSPDPLFGAPSLGSINTGKPNEALCFRYEDLPRTQGVSLNNLPTFVENCNKLYQLWLPGGEAQARNAIPRIDHSDRGAVA